MRGKRAFGKYDHKKYEWFSIFKFVIIIAIATLLVLAIVIGISRVDGESMMPTLKSDQTVLYLRLSGELSKGDIVAIKMPSGDKYVKRVIGIEGDTIDIKDGRVYRNGRRLSEAYVRGRTEAYRGVTYPYTVESGKVFVMGDNREDSVDSRTFGAVIEEDIKGRILFH